MDLQTRRAATVIWNYMRLDMELHPSDCIVGFGCYNDDIPLRCAQLYHQGYAPKILFTGGLGRNTAEMWTESEADRFGRIASEAGVPQEALILENKSTNSAENILFTKDKLTQVGLTPSRLIGVHKPFMERRLYAAWQVYWPEMPIIVTSPQLTLDEYIKNSMAQGLSEKKVIDVMVGDFQRIDVYAKRGYQIPQEIPQQVWDAFHELMSLGHTSELV